MFRLSRLLRLAVVAALVWAALVYGLPLVRRVLPKLCEQRNLHGGVCAADMQRRLATLDEWAQTRLRPLVRHARVQWAVAEAKRAFAHLERLVRNEVGDERLDGALRGADVALRRMEEILGEGGDARAKILDVPANAQMLLRRVRETFDHLQAVIRTTGERTEEVSGAVEETRKALDALSSILPGEKQ